MWTRLFPSSLPTPLPTEDARRKNVRERLLDEDEDDAYPPPLKKRAHFSIRPIFDKYNGRKSNQYDPQIDLFRGPRNKRTSPSAAPESPMIGNLKRNYAALRVTLHSSTAKNTVEAEEALITELNEKVNANISKLNKVASRERELFASTLDCEVDTELTSKDGQKRTCTRQARRALSSYQEAEVERAKQLAQLWDSWEKTRADADELWNKFQELVKREPCKGTSGISSNHESTEKEDFDIERRIKQVVEEMTACEEEFQEKLKDEETNILEAMLECSLG